jgi:hypothetical protein
MVLLHIVQQNIQSLMTLTIRLKGIPVANTDEGLLVARRTDVHARAVLQETKALAGPHHCPDHNLSLVSNCTVDVARCHLSSCPFFQAWHLGCLGADVDHVPPVERGYGDRSWIHHHFVWEGAVEGGHPKTRLCFRRPSRREGTSWTVND